MKKIDEIKKFLEIDELSKLEQGAIQGGATETKQKCKCKCKCDGEADSDTAITQL